MEGNRTFSTEEAEAIEKRRVEFHSILKEMLESDEVYFQKPSNRKMRYPAILYDLDNVQIYYSNNHPYVSQIRYSVTYISDVPDMTVPMKLGSLSTASFDRFYTADNFNHYVYRVYF